MVSKIYAAHMECRLGADEENRKFQSRKQHLKPKNKTRIFADDYIGLPSPEWSLR